MFDKQTVVDRIEVMADHTVAVRYVVTVTEDGQLFLNRSRGTILNLVMTIAKRMQKYNQFVL